MMFYLVSTKIALALLVENVTGEKNKDQINCCMLVFGRLVKIKAINIPRIPEIQFDFGRPWSNFVGAIVGGARRKGD